jgi:hypothetical protein
VRVVAIDWSGAKSGARKKIWAAEFRDDEPVPELVTGKDRTEISNYLIDAARDNPKLIVGLDFAFSFPCWFVKDQANSAQELWAKVEHEGELWLRECNEPFWGRKNAPRWDLGDKPHYRRTEQIGSVGGIRPKSVFQINGAGAVGTGSIRGMAVLHQLSSYFRVWPFDAEGWPRIIEIWPRALTGPITKSNEEQRKKYLANNHPNIPTSWRDEAEKSEDAFDAVVSACVMQKHKDSLSSLTPTGDPILRLEGQIWYPSS